MHWSLRTSRRLERIISARAHQGLEDEVMKDPTALDGPLFRVPYYGDWFSG
jgi:hypothetical protein